MRERASTGTDGAAVTAATVTAGLFIAQQVAGKATRDTLFLSSFPVSLLPAAMTAAALASMLSVFGFARALARRSPARVVPQAAAAAMSLLVVEWAVSLSLPRLAAVLVYLHLAVFGAILVSGFWSVVNERFDPYTAKRVVGRIGMGASLGAVAGGALTWGAADLIPVPAMLLLMAGLNGAGLVGLARLVPKGPAEPMASAEEGSADAFAGLRVLRQVPYLRDLGFVVALAALLDALLDYAFNVQAVESFGPGHQLISFFALFHTAVGLLAAVVQSALSRRSLQGLGLAGTAALQPALVGVAALVGALDPRLWTATLARATKNVLHGSLFRSGYELLYTPLPEREKRPSKAIVDVGFDKVGTIAGSGLAALAVAAGPGHTTRVLFVIGAVAALGALAVTRRLHRGYIAALEGSLRSGVVRLDLAEVVDATTRLTLAQTGVGLDRDTLLGEIQALRRAPEAETGGLADPLLRTIQDLRSPRPEPVRRALRAAAPDPRLVAHLVPLLARDDVFADVLRPLRKLAPRVTGQLLDALLDADQDPVVRRRIPRVLKACPTQRAVDGLLLGLADERFDVRYHCGRALARLTERGPGLAVPREAVFAAVLRELQAGAHDGTSTMATDSSGRRRAASTAASGPELEHVFTLLSLVLEREPLQISFWAMRGEDQPLRGTALEYLDNVLPEDVRAALWPHLGAGALAPRTARPRERVVDELLHSTDSLTLSRDALRHRGVLPKP